MAIRVMIPWTRGVRAAAVVWWAVIVALFPSVLVFSIEQWFPKVNPFLSILALIWCLVGAPSVFFRMLRRHKFGFAEWLDAGYRDNLDRKGVREPADHTPDA